MFSKIKGIMHNKFARNTIIIFALILNFIIIAAPGTVHNDPFVNSNFSLTSTQFNGIFKSARFIGSENEVVERKISGKGGAVNIQYVPGAFKTMKIELVRNLTDDMSLSDWRQLIADGKLSTARVDATLTLLNQSGTAVVKWELDNVWPSKLVVGGENEQILTETVTLTSEGIKRVNP